MGTMKTIKGSELKHNQWFYFYVGDGLGDSSPFIRRAVVFDGRVGAEDEHGGWVVRLGSRWLLEHDVLPVDGPHVSYEEAVKAASRLTLADVKPGGPYTLLHSDGLRRVVVKLDVGKQGYGSRLVQGFIGASIPVPPDYVAVVEPSSGIVLAFPEDTEVL